MFVYPNLFLANVVTGGEMINLRRLHRGISENVILCFFTTYKHCYVLYSAGVYGFPHCPGDNYTICEYVRKLLNFGAYESFVQNQ